MSDPKVSRMVADRVTISRTVTSAVELHGPEVAPALEKALFPAGAPQNLTIAGMLTALGALLDSTTTRVLEADQAHAAELADDPAPRAARNDHVAEIRDFLSTLRSNLGRNYGETVPAAYGLGSVLPEDPAALLLLAGNVEKQLRERPLTEAPKKQSLKVDPIAAADDLKASAKELKSALDDVERERREAQLTLGAKNDAISEWGTNYSGVADAVAALFALARRPDLADRVRPTARRRAGLLEPEDAPAPEPEPNQGPGTG